MMLHYQIISIFWDHLGIRHITDKNMRQCIKRAVIKLDLAKYRLTEARAGTHIFRVGGMKALKIARADQDDIKTMGR